MPEEASPAAKKIQCPCHNCTVALKVYKSPNLMTPAQAERHLRLWTATPPPCGWSEERIAEFRAAPGRPPNDQCRCRERRRDRKAQR